MSVYSDVPDTPVKPKKRIIGDATRTSESSKKKKRKRQLDEEVVESGVAEKSKSSLDRPGKLNHVTSTHGGLDESLERPLVTAMDFVPDSQTSKPSKQIQSRSGSSFHIQTTSFYVSLSPITQSSPLQGLCGEHLSPLILTYFPPLKGVVLAYQNPRLTNDPQGAAETEGSIYAQVVSEYAVSFTWLTAEFLLFKPRRGDPIEGQVMFQNESQIGLVCWNYFNVSISNDHIPSNWQWMGPSTNVSHQTATRFAGDRDTADEGYYVDEDGDSVGGKLQFRVLDFEAFSAHGGDRYNVKIEGTLLAMRDLAARLKAERRSRRMLKGMKRSTGVHYF